MRTGVGYHIDGPMSELQPPQRQKVSDVLKSVEIPEEINIVIAPAMSIEATQFWEMIEVYVMIMCMYMNDSTMYAFF